MSYLDKSSKNSVIISSIAASNFTTEAAISDEARYNLATRIMSNGVEVIIAGDKSKTTLKSIEISQSALISSNTDELQLPSLQIKKPMTLAPSTLSSQMILHVPNNLRSNFTIPNNTNRFVTKTCLTTYTYRTTYLQDGTTTVESREKVIANVATEERNYPIYNSTLSRGVTLTRTPQLAVGIYPTTYSYFFTLYDGESTKMMVSDHTVMNTITAPDDYISFLQPSEAASPVYDTNTYFNKIVITKTLEKRGSLKVTTNSETLTQVIVTESLPARSTSVLTSYYAFDVDETLSQAFATNYSPKLQVPQTESNYDLHIYATKTFLTTFTYLTTSTLLKSSNIQDLELVSSEYDSHAPSFTTAVNYHTRVIENVIAQAIPTTLLKPELIKKFRKELKRGKNHRGVIVTLATLVGGQTLEITAMKYINPKTLTSSGDHSSTTYPSQTNTTDTTDIELILPSNLVEPEEKPINSSLKTTKPFQVRDPNKNTNLDSNYEPSDLIPTVIKINSEKLNKNITNEISQATKPSHVNILGSLNGLTVLRPVFSAMADLLQSKFISNGNVPESKNYLKHSATSTKHELSNHENPIYIPFQNTNKKSHKKAQGNLIGEGNNFDIVKKFAPPQSLHIQPPEADLALSDDNWIHGKYMNENKHLVSDNKDNKRNQQPLINGGIPIRPGEVITANSDVIVGKPNGIEQPNLYTFQSNSIPLRRGISQDQSIVTFGFPKNHTYYQKNTFKHAFYGPKYSMYTTLRPIENFDNILRPPPSPQFLGLNDRLYPPRPPSIGSPTPDLLPFRQSPIALTRDQESLKKDVQRYPQRTYLNSNLNENDVMDTQRTSQVLLSSDRPPSDLSTYEFLNQEAQSQFQLRSHSPNSTSNLLFPDLKSNRLKNQDTRFQGTSFLRNLSQHSNHQRVNLQTNVLSHNVAINVPPLTFKKEPELVTPVLHGVPSNSGQLSMPHIKIQANEDEVQVNLTPNHRVYPQSIFFNKSPSVQNVSISSLSNDRKISTTNISPKPNQNWNDVAKFHFTPSSEEYPLNILGNFNRVKIPIEEDFVKVVKPNSVLKSIQTTVNSNKEWHMHNSNSENNIKTKDQSGDFSTLKNQLMFSQQPNDLTYYNISRQAQSQNPHYPVLNPLTALQVNYLEAPSSKSERKTEFPSQSKMNSNIAALNKPKIVSNVKQSTSSSIVKPTYSSPSIYTSRSTSKLSDKWTTIRPSQVKSQSTVSNHNRTHQKNTISYTYGQPFTQHVPPSNNASNKQHLQNRKTYADINLLIVPGQSFKLNHPPHQFNKNISEKIDPFPHLNSSKLRSDDQKNFLNSESVAKLNMKSSSKNELLYTEETIGSQKSPTIRNYENNITLLRNKTYLDIYYSSTIPAFSKSHPSVNKTYLSHSSEFVEMYPESSHSTFAIPKNSFTKITNSNYRPVELSSTDDLTTQTMPSKPYLNLNYFKTNNYSLSSTVNDNNKIIWKHSTLTQTEFTSSPTKMQINHSPIIEETLHFTQSSINLDHGAKETATLPPKTSFIASDHEYHQANTNRDSQIVLEPSMDLSNFGLTFSMEHLPSSSLNIKNSSNVVNLVESTQRTPSLRKLLRVTKFITHTVTTTTTTVATSTIKKNERENIHNNFQMTTFLLTTTLTTTVIDTVNEILSIIQPTKTVDSDSYNFVATSIVRSTTSELDFLLPETSNIPDNVPQYDISFEKTNNDLNPATGDNDNIFIVMTNRQGAPTTKTSMNYSHIDSEEDPAIRDEEIFLGAENGINNNILFGRVLIETPSDSNILSRRPPDIKQDNISAMASGCRPACKTSRNELCSETSYECVCRPGFARMFPDRPCRPTYTYTMRLTLIRLANRELMYNDSLSNNSTKYFQELATITRDALERMVMQSDFRDVYQGLIVKSYSSDDTNQTLIANTVLQFSDMNEEKRLEDVFKKYLRVNGYSIGLTELYTDKRGAETITVLDFDECFSPSFHDCATNARCFNLKGTYTCSCNNGYIDLSENSLFPGRICSSEVIGCEKCNYHGQCTPIIKTKLKDDPWVCDCFAWYSGSMCQLNLKILLIALIAVGSILFVILLVCILLTCTKHRKNNKTFSEALFAEVQDTRSKPKGLFHVKVNSKERNKAINIQRTMKADKRAMILDTSSQSSDSSLPYVLKDSIRRDRKQHKKIAVHKAIANENCVPVINEPIKEFSMNIHSPAGKHTPQIFAHCPTNTLFTEIEQSDRSLTVMIPRAKYYPSVLPQIKLLHHQLTLERTNAASLKQLNEHNAKQTESGLGEEQNTLRVNNIPGASLVSAGFEVSAMVNANSLCSSYKTPKIIAITHEDPENSFVDSISTRCQYNAARANILNANNAQNSVSSNDDTMDEWFKNMQEIPSSTGRQSFGDSTFRLIKFETGEHDNQTINTNEEANTMAERDVSTFLLPHTHLYKSEKESDISGLDSL